MIIGKLRRDVTDDKDVVRDWDFQFIHRAFDSDSGCLEVSFRMVYCAAFDCNANSSKNIVTYSWLKFPREPTLPALLASRKRVSTAIRTRKDGSPGLSWW